MWTRTPLTEALGIAYPIVQGPFGGGLSSVELLSTVSNLGGLGSFGLQSFTPDQIIALDAEIKQRTNKPYALNLWVRNRDEMPGGFTEDKRERVRSLFKPYFDELGLDVPQLPASVPEKFDVQVEAVLRVKPPVFSFVFGIPPVEVLRELAKRGIRTMGAVTTPDEAIAMEEAGVDVIVATGLEAGGHRPSFLRSAEDSLTGGLALIPQVVDVVKKPVVAAGGIADVRGMKAAFALGAHGVQIGTAFLATAESNAPEAHKRRLFSLEARYTTLTRAFSGRLARGIRSRISMDMRDHQHELAPYPLQTELLSRLRQEAIAHGSDDLITFWSGQGAPLLEHRHARDLFESLVRGME